MRLPKVLHHMLSTVSIFKDSALTTRNTLLTKQSCKQANIVINDGNSQAHLHRQRRVWFSTAKWLMQSLFGKEFAG